MQQCLLGLRKRQICLIAGCGAVAGITFFAFQRFIQADHYDCDI